MDGPNRIPRDESRKAGMPPNAGGPNGRQSLRYAAAVEFVNGVA
jgi:hypothetical protein